MVPGAEEGHHTRTPKALSMLGSRGMYHGSSTLSYPRRNARNPCFSLEGSRGIESLATRLSVPDSLDKDRIADRLWIGSRIDDCAKGSRRNPLLEEIDVCLLLA